MDDWRAWSIIQAQALRPSSRSRWGGRGRGRDSAKREER